MGPLARAPRLSTSARRAVLLLGGIGVLQAVAVLACAEAVAAAVSGVATGSGLPPWWLAVLLAGVLLRSAAALAAEATAVRAAAATKAELRAAVLARVAGPGEHAHSGSLTLLLTRGLDELDRWFGVYLPALAGAAVLPALVGLRLLLADWPSAVLVALTVPLVPVFMVLIGRFTAERSAAALEALGRLGEHVAELARGLPVLRGLGRAGDAAAALAASGEAHRVRTMRTLRLAFLSALALELIATLSVALVAVVVGIRLLHGELDLRTGLLVLVLAPECYLPLRAVGTAYHAAAGGVAAFGRVAALLDAPAERVAVHGPAGDVVVRGLSVRRAGQSRPVPENVCLRVPARGFVAVTGASGCGKSTLLAVLSGRLGGDAVRGRVSGVDFRRIALVPQHPRTTEPTVRAEVLLAGAPLGAVSGDAVRAALSDVDLLGLAERDPAGLSVGELHRLALARALVRVRLGAHLLLLDEPSAHLDSATEAVLAGVLARLRGTVTIVLVSHREALLRLADEVLGIVAPGGTTPGADTAPSAATAAPVTPHEPSAVPAPPAGRHLLAVVLGAGASVSGLALTATSAWLIVRAAQLPPMLTLLVAIVGVRAFGIGRAVLRYAERLVGHDAVLRHAVALRSRLWRALGGAVAQRGPRDALNRLVSDVDTQADLTLRAVLPLAVAVLTGTAVAVAGWLVLPPGYGALPGCVVAAVLLVVPALAVWTERRASAVRAAHGNRLVARVGALLGAPELAVHRADAALRAEVAGIDAALSAGARRTAYSAGLAGAALILLCGLGSAAGIALAARGVAAGTLAPVLAGVLALLPLALVDALAPVIPAAQQLRGLPAARARLRDTLTVPAAPTRDTAPPRITSLRLRGVTARWPGQPHAPFDPVDVTLHRGDWLAVTGPSGAGKSTLLAVLLGFLAPSTGDYRVSGVDAAALRLTDRIGWCPQEATLFAATVRGNLTLARGPVPDARLRAVLRTVGLDKDLGTVLGEAGGTLSGGEGQRLAVARALLRDADVVLLDEPTAHLDAAGGAALLADLRTALAGRIVVLVTHDPAQAAHCTGELVLTGGAGAPGGCPAARCGTMNRERPPEQ